MFEDRGVEAAFEDLDALGQPVGEIAETEVIRIFEARGIDTAGLNEEFNQLVVRYKAVLNEIENPSGQRPRPGDPAFAQICVYPVDYDPISPAPGGGRPGRKFPAPFRRRPARLRPTKRLLVALDQVFHPPVVR